MAENSEKVSAELGKSVPRRVLLVFAHPMLHKSRVNRRLLAGVEDLEGVTVDDLYEKYPDFDVDTQAEQRLLEAHDAIVLQFPFYWYATPALLKQWFDLVFEHNWAYGHAGNALKGKLMLCALSAGGGQENYCAGGSNSHTVAELLAPIKLTARLCSMDYLPPFVVFGTHRLGDQSFGPFAEDYRRLLVALRDRRVDMASARALDCLSADLDAVLIGDDMNT